MCTTHHQVMFVIGTEPFPKLDCRQVMDWPVLCWHYRPISTLQVLWQIW